MSDNVPPENKQTRTAETSKEKIIIDGRECKIVNSVTVMEIIAHKLDNGKEIQQVVAQEFMMTEHKIYLIRCLTDAINTVMRAQSRPEKIIKSSHIPRIMDFLRRKK